MDERDELTSGATDPNGDTGSLEEAARVVYQELRALAGAYFRSQRSDHTLEPTALVNEAFVKLAGNTQLSWVDETHFFSIAAKAMREILADHARKRRTSKRGGDRQRLTLSGIGSNPGVVDALDLDDALTKLREVNARQVEIIELRFYGGLTVEQVARLLGISPRTVELDSRMARAWLSRHIEEIVPRG